uniref:Alkaline ceramidase n=1 Tax=Vitis vinifera TaxID=29760 RepID=A5AKR2_VITVI|nr:hypothetical protein VITISV_042374 [Vitis vinifera]
MVVTLSNHSEILAIHEANSECVWLRTKHISPKFFYTHELQKKCEIDVQYIQSCNNLADLFTKALPSTTLKKLRSAEYVECDHELPFLGSWCSGFCPLPHSRAEVWGWALYYAGTTSVAFGSSYYHLKPDDNRVIWDKLPIMIAYSSLFASFIMERVGEMIGLTCLFTLNLVALVGVACERAFNDLRLCMMFQLIPGIAIPAMTFMFTPKYTHSRYWLCATGVYLLAKFESVADNKVYRATWYLISGHSLEHLCSVIFPVLLTLMLIFRSIKTPRYLSFVVVLYSMTKNFVFPISRDI